MIERTYKCDLCRSERDPENLVPIYWRTDDCLVRSLESVQRAERHLCKRCIADIKANL